jgi:UPF0755 protein
MKRWIKFILIFFVLALAAVSVLSVFIYRDLHRAVSHDKSQTYIEISKGSSPNQIVGKVASEGVIRRSWPLLLYIRLTGAAPQLKAGEYRFPSPISPLTVLRKLKEGEQRLGRFTIIEGWTRWDIAESMLRLPELKLTNEEDAVLLMSDISLIRDLSPDASNLEGYLFPDTYKFPPDTTPKAMIELIVKRFRQEWNPEWSAKASALGVTPHQVVTIASLIETEAKLKEERPLIASVIYNRLKRRMALGVDSSVIYASKLAGKWRADGKVYQSDLDRQSPYNTRLTVGLPPGPIGSPGASSLEAALNPAETDYIYYVREPSRNDGAHNFYSDEANFQRGVQKLRDWEKARDTR